MIRYTSANQLSFDNFSVPSYQSLDAHNRWVKLATIVPWDKLAMVAVICPDAPKLKGAGRPTADLRLVIGALLVQQIEDLSDIRTLELIRENVYVQHFCGLPGFQSQAPFEASSLTHWRKWFGNNGAAELNEVVADAMAALYRSHTGKSETKANDTASSYDQKPDPPTNEEGSGYTASEPDQKLRDDQKLSDDQAADPDGELAATDLPSRLVSDGKSHYMLDNKLLGKHKGTLLIDATCAPADIRYPTDVALCNDGREWSERIIDKLYSACVRLGCAPKIKPRTYRKVARKHFVQFCYKKRPGRKKSRKVARQQLQYLERNLRSIDILLKRLMTSGPRPFTRLIGSDNWPSGQLPNEIMSRQEWQRLRVSSELARQQRLMADATERKAQNSVSDRIVSLAQPHIRPIVRGKASAPVEFGPKFDVSLVDGVVRVERFSYNAYHEGLTLISACARYASCYGHLPERVEADTAYLSRANRQVLKQWGITPSGKPLGRPPTKDPEAVKRYREMCQVSGDRNPVEGWFGLAKRRYGLRRLSTKLASTTNAAVHFKVMAINLMTALRKGCLHAQLRVCQRLVELIGLTGYSFNMNRYLIENQSLQLHKLKLQRI